jgi:hypothetical protein
VSFSILFGASTLQEAPALHPAHDLGHGRSIDTRAIDNVGLRYTTTTRTARPL